MMADKPTITLDFDGVLHSYTSGWQGADVIADPPVPGAMQFLARAVQEFTVAVHSSRSASAVATRHMREWIGTHLKATFGEEVGYAILEQIQFPYEKPPAHVSIDDRALTFKGVWPDMEVLRSFKPWNRMEAASMTHGKLPKIVEIENLDTDVLFAEFEKAGDVELRVTFVVSYLAKVAADVALAADPAAQAFLAEGYAIEFGRIIANMTTKFLRG